MTYKIPSQKPKVIEMRGSDLLLVYRVPYGKDTTSKEDREYWIQEGSPVGNKKEWLKFAKEKGFKGVRFVDKEGVTFEFIN
jgi:hypothetical protein